MLLSELLEKREQKFGTFPALPCIAAICCRRDCFFEHMRRRTLCDLRSCRQASVQDKSNKNSKKGYRIIWSTGPEPVDQKIVVPTLSGLHAGQHVAQKQFLIRLNMSPLVRADINFVITSCLYHKNCFAPRATA